ncbi:MAG: sulfatase, partial [Victivallales bacterium]|nr:sulfatase [Victivallales bacterium]
FQRLSEKSVTFDNCYVGSMPCMPARRELHTGRYNFLHRSWSPLEPFDDSMPELLKNNGVLSHLVSDHYHYWEEGGANYHTKFSNWQISRGQEGDFWMGDLADPDFPNPNPRNGVVARQDWINRAHINSEEEMPQAKTFAMGLDFMERNSGEDDWFLQIETFDPHEPYFVQEKFKELYYYDFSKSTRDWPACTNAENSPDHVELFEHFRKINAALVSMCDEYLGRVLDKMDELNLWDDTMLIVNTDHGFLLGEHDWWGKCRMPFYNELANTPFCVWDPRSGKSGERRQSLVQTIDIAPTLLELFGIDIPKDMQGKSLRKTVEIDAPVREAGLFGIHGGHVNVTDGRYVYMRAPVNDDNSPLFQYTLMPAHMKKPFSVDEIHRLEGLAEPFEFTKGCKTMKINASSQIPGNPSHAFGHMLFDLKTDPKQENPLDDPEIEAMMIDHLVREMRANDAPIEQYERLGLGVSQ